MAGVVIDDRTGVDVVVVVVVGVVTAALAAERMADAANPALEKKNLG